MALLNVAECITCTAVEGPGNRFALWVQGCVIRCRGCCNPHFLDLTPRRLIDSSEATSLIAKARLDHGIEGVTFLGGEPMLQARGLSDVAKAAQRLGLSVMVFTGYRIEELDGMRLPGVPELLAATDLLVDGPYVAEMPESSRNWIGSSNQRVHYLTERYEPSIETDPAFGCGIELRVQKDATIKLNGWPVDVTRRKTFSLS